MKAHVLITRWRHLKEKEKWTTENCSYEQASELDAVLLALNIYSGWWNNRHVEALGYACEMVIWNQDTDKVLLRCYREPSNGIPLYQDATDRDFLIRALAHDRHGLGVVIQSAGDQAAGSSCLINIKLGS